MITPKYLEKYGFHPNKEGLYKIELCTSFGNLTVIPSTYFLECIIAKELLFNASIGYYTDPITKKVEPSIKRLIISELNERLRGMGFLIQIENILANQKRIEVYSESTPDFNADHKISIWYLNGRDRRLDDTGIGLTRNLIEALNVLTEVTTLLRETLC